LLASSFVWNDAHPTFDIPILKEAKADVKMLWRISTHHKEPNKSDNTRTIVEVVFRERKGARGITLGT